MSPKNSTRTRNGLLLGGAGYHVIIPTAGSNRFWKFLGRPTVPLSSPAGDAMVPPLGHRHYVVIRSIQPAAQYCVPFNSLLPCLVTCSLCLDIALQDTHIFGPGTSTSVDPFWQSSRYPSALSAIWPNRLHCSVCIPHDRLLGIGTDKSDVACDHTPHFYLTEHPRSLPNQLW
jgi:hypothetical protein